MKITFEDISIAGIACASPYQRLDLNSLSNEHNEIEVNRIIASICSARDTDKDETVSNVCITSASRLLNMLNIKIKEIDAIIFVSHNSDVIMPATSTIIQYNPGMIVNVATIDNNVHCTGYFYGLYQSAILISAGGCNRIVLCTGDAITRLLHPKDSQVRMVFGDAAWKLLADAS